MKAPVFFGEGCDPIDIIAGRNAEPVMGHVVGFLVARNATAEQN
jgi:hypothetical protein